MRPTPVGGCRRRRDCVTWSAPVSVRRDQRQNQALSPEETILRISRPRPGSLVASIVLAAAMLGLSLGLQVPGVAAGGANAQASELVRLINGTRQAVGKSSLNVDTTLASLATSGQIPCPDTSTQTTAGRAEDFGTYKYLNHNLRNCLGSTVTFSSTTFVSLLQSQFGYGSVGEIVAMNSGYGTAKYLYSYNGWSTYTYSTSSHAVGTATTGWMGSSSHRAIILGSYNRVGCGGWYAGGGYYYDCLFSAGGPGAIVAPPTKSPFADVVPTAAPTRAPAPVPTKVPSVSPTKTPAAATDAPTAAVTAATVPAFGASASQEVAGIVASSASPTTDPAAAAQLESGSTTLPKGGMPLRDRVIRGALLSAAALALFAAGGLMLRLMRRGRGGTTA
jgi:uncharacterized protein YkwD